MITSRLIFIIILILLLKSCSPTSETKNDDTENSTVLSVNSLPEIDSLNSKILSSITPLFPNIDTLVLNDSPPLYCGNTSEEEIAKNYFPISIHPSYFLILNKKFGMTILYKSKVNGYDPDFSTKVQLSLNGTIYNKNKILISESYTRDFNYCSIEKWFTYTNGKWTCEPKEKECSTPIPTFKTGGRNGLVEFLKKNLKYPSDSIEGKVFVGFNVDTNGRTTDIKVLRGLSESADKEVIRVIKLLEFIPATQGGKKVFGYMTLPVTFKTNSN